MCEKKFLMPLLCLVVALSLSATAARGANILFVSSMTEEGDDALKAFMEGLGHTVTYIDDDEDEATTEAAATAADMVFISESVGSGGIKNEITEIEVPMIVGEPWAWDEMGLTEGDGGDDPAVTTDVEIVDPGHYMAAGLSGTVAVLTDIPAGCNLGKGITGPEATVIATATLSDGQTYDVIFVYEKGAALPVAPADGSAQVAADIRIGIGFHASCFPALGDNYYALLGAAIDYALGLAAALPEGWQSQDIGTTGGSAAESDGTWLITADGADVWGSADEFHYAYVPLSGDGTIIARVVSNGEGSNGWAKGGVMIRETLDQGSKHAIMAMTGGEGGGMAFQCRPETDSSDCKSSHDLVPAAPPYWVKLTRVGNTFTGYSSADGVEWLQQPTRVNGDGTEVPIDIEMAEDVYIGLFVTSHASGELRTYMFDNVSIELPIIAPEPVDPGTGNLVHSWTFDDGTADDVIGDAEGVLIGDAAVVDGQLVLDGDGDWMDMPGDVIAINTFEGLTIEVQFTSVAGGNTGYHMVTAFGEEGTGENPGYGYKYVCITPARGNDVSRGMIQTVSMDNDPWSEETGVSDVIEHDDGLPHHMVCTVDDMELAFYIDGVLIGTAALDPPGNSIAGLGTDVARIGKGVYGVDPLWAGSVEELNIYNRALSLAEVQANYAAGPQKVGPAPVDPGTEGLMLHLPLDTASRGVTQDSSDNDLDGTLFGEPTFVEGVDIMALQLDGVDDYVDCDNPSALDFGTGDFTISAWINMTATERGTVYAKGGDNSGGIRYTLAMGEGNNDGKMTLTTDDDSTKVQALGGTVVNDGAWHHVVAMRSGTDLLVYVDGVLDGTNTVPDGYDLSGTSQANALIGAITDARDATGATLEKFFAGIIDDVRIYNRALSAEEVLFLAGM